VRASKLGFVMVGASSMRRFVFAQLLSVAAWIVGMGVVPGASPQRSTDDDDRAVISAILEHTIRPQVDRANGNSTPVPPLFVFNRSVAICKGAPAEHPCVWLDQIEFLADSSGAGFFPPRDQVIKSDAILRELIESFKSRNQVSRPLPRLKERGA